VGWAALGVALEGAALGCALHGVGAGVPLLVTAAAYAVLHLVWTVLPVTAPPGAADVALLLVLLALGTPLAAACAGVVAFRLVSFWLPVLAGALLAARLERRLAL
jgi:undecaprenyl-diphosphatase